VLLISSKTVGEGLNLQKGSHVLVIYDAVVDSAVDDRLRGRIARFGQEKTPEIFIFVTLGTYDHGCHIRNSAKWQPIIDVIRREKTSLRITDNETSLNGMTSQMLLGLWEGIGPDQHYSAENFASALAYLSLQMSRMAPHPVGEGTMVDVLDIIRRKGTSDGRGVEA